MSQIHRALDTWTDIELFDYFKNVWVVLIFGLAAVVTVATPVVTGWFSVAWALVYVLIVLLITVTAYSVALLNYSADLREEKSELESEMEEKDEYYSLIDSMYSSPVEIQEKETFVNINVDEENNDRVEFTDRLCALDGFEVDEYYALIGITGDKDISWDDLDIQTSGGTVDEYKRRDYENVTRYIIKFLLSDLVDDQDSHELVYGFEHDVVSAEQDEAFVVIREPTGTARVEIKFPEGWVPERSVANGRSEDLDRNLPQPDQEQDEDGRWWIKWNCSSCKVGESYIIDWTATPQ